MNGLNTFMALVTYNGLEVADPASGHGGQAITDNFKLIIDKLAGTDTEATALGAFATGYNQDIINGGLITASGQGSFASGIARHNTNSSYLPACGQILASGKGSFAHGSASGYNSTSYKIEASAEGSVAFGLTTDSDHKATGLASTVFGQDCEASGAYSFAVGTNNTATNIACVALGSGTQATANYAFALGQGSEATAAAAFACGSVTHATGLQSHTTGHFTTASGTNSHAEGDGSVASIDCAHAEGKTTTASGYASHAEGLGTVASGYNSHAEGTTTTASGLSSHTEGAFTIASNSGYYGGNHAEGYSTTSSGSYGSHAEGWSTTASGIYGSHAEGHQTTASGITSHAEGNGTTASGNYGHVEGLGTLASGESSHAEGCYSIANLYSQHAFASGKFATDGDAQGSRVVVYNYTNNNTPTELFIHGAGGNIRLIIPNDTTWAFSVLIVARRTDADSEGAAYKVEGAIDNNANTVALIATATTVLAEDVGGWDVAAEADNTNKALIIKVTGENAKTIYWVATVNLTQVTG